MSIPLIVFGSTLVLGLLTRFPLLVWGGVALLGWIAGDILCSDPLLAGWLHPRWPSYGTWDGAAGAGFVLLIAWLGRRLTAAREAI